jgi:hypothetical protein
MGTDNNSLPELLDLRLRVQDCSKPEGHKEIRVDLRVNRADFDGPDDSIISVAVQKTTLELQLSGLEAIPNTRLGEPVRELQVTEKQTTKVTTGMEGTATARAGIDVTKVVPATLSLSADAKVQAKVSSTFTSKQAITAFRVKARGGDTWEVSEPQLKTGEKEAPLLDGTYLSDAVLCNAKPARGANIKSVGLTAYAKQRDLKLDISRASVWQVLGLNQEKLFSIFVAKSLGQVGSKYSGVVKLSHSEIEVED